MIMITDPVLDRVGLAITQICCWWVMKLHGDLATFCKYRGLRDRAVRTIQTAPIAYSERDCTHDVYRVIITIHLICRQYSLPELKHEWIRNGR